MLCIEMLRGKKANFITTCMLCIEKKKESKRQTLLLAHATLFALYATHQNVYKEKKVAVAD